jgi:hypothetical protein
MRAYVLLMLSLSAGCSQNPSAPTTVSAPSSTSPNLSNALSITEFSLQGWQDGIFHYLPTVSVSAPSTGGTVDVARVEFTASNGVTTTRLTGIVFGMPRRVAAPGDTVDLFKGMPPVEITSSVALTSITATVTFTNGAGQAGTVAVTKDAPRLVPDPSAAALVIQAFSVMGSSDSGSFSYWPKLTLTETSGVSRALIKKMTFELLDVGPSGRVPPSWEPREVPAGGSITLDEDDYGYGPWLEITSMADASRVSLAISFVDDAGRGGSVTAVAPVSR